MAWTNDQLKTWRTTTNVPDMIRLLVDLPTLNSGEGERIRNNKLRLYSAATLRRNPEAISHLKEGPINAIRIAERYATGEATSEELAAAYRSVIASYAEHDPHDFDALHVAAAATQKGVTITGFYPNADYLREIFGPDPSREAFYINPAWRTTDVMPLAQGIHDNQAYDRMPILADALQDAGCDNDDLLAQCRDTNRRAFWVIDAILGLTCKPELKPATQAMPSGGVAGHDPAAVPTPVVGG